MKQNHLPRASFVLRPSVAISIAWFGALSMWSLMQFAIAKYPTDPEVDLRLISGTEYAAVSALHRANNRRCAKRPGEVDDALDKVDRL